MPTCQFTLIAEGPDLQSGLLVDALFEAGCDDALVRRAEGVQYLDFNRQAPSPAEAALLAISDVEAVEGVAVVRLADAGQVSLAGGLPDCQRPAGIDPQDVG